MQYPKEELRAKILNTARQEFLSKGFQRASLRRIARNAGMTTGGIYTYFRSKADIFETIVNKVVEKWNSRYEFYLSVAGVEKKFIPTVGEENLEHSVSYYNFLINFVNLYRDEMKLLLFKSEGTRFENFPNILAENALVTAKSILLKIPSIDSYSYFRVSDFFLKNIINFNLNLIKEMLIQDISLEEMLDYEEEISSFFYSGWKAVLSQYSA